MHIEMQWVKRWVRDLIQIIRQFVEENMVKIKYTTIYKIIIYMIFFLNLGFLNIKSDYAGGIAKLSGSVAILLFIVYLFQPRKVRISKWIVVYIMSFCVEIIFQILRGGIIESLSSTYAMAYFSILYVFPLNEICKDSKNSNFFKSTLTLGVIAEFFRIFVWYIYNFLHINIAPGFFRLGLDWVRNGHVRMQTTFLDSFIFFILIYLAVEAWNNINIKRLLLYLGLGIVYLFYAYFVYAARTVFLMYIFGAVLIIILNRSKNIRKSITSIALLCIIFFIFYNMPFVQEILSSMLNDGGTTIRTNGMALYGDLYKSTSILNGLGLNSDIINFGIVMNGVHITTYSLSDLRIIGDLYRFGIIGFTICIYIYIYICVKILVGLRKSYVNTVVVALLLFFIIGASLYERIYIMQLPLLVTMAENYDLYFTSKNGVEEFKKSYKYSNF